MPCSHTSWLRLSKQGPELALQVSDRPKRLLAAIGPEPAEGSALVLFIGNKRKADAIRRLGLNYRSSSGQRGHGDVHLFVVPNGQLPRPTIIADSDIPNHNRVQSWRATSRCHEATDYPLASEDTSRQGPRNAADIVYQRLLFPFADVVCIFTDDIGGMTVAARRLAAWLNCGRPSNGPVLPWLLVVVEEKVKRGGIVDELERRVTAHTGIELSTRFEGIRAVHLSARPNLRHRQRYKYRHWASFDRELCGLVECSGRMRAESSHLYSTKHLTAYLRHATALIPVRSEPFDFISASRATNRISSNLEFHLSDFLNRVETIETFKGFGIPVIASSVILDHYSPRMHRFDPTEVFMALYEQACARICRRAFKSVDGTSHLVLPSAFILLIKSELQRQFSQYGPRVSSASQHRLRLLSLRSHWRGLYSEDTCFSCLMRRPKYKLRCNHWMCDVCFHIFGVKRSIYLYLPSCLLCGEDTRDMRLRVKPDTATPRVLCIDGGGSRACVPLRFLQELQDRIGLPYPVQYNFDILFGTSSGAISICGLGINGWSVDDCVAATRALAMEVFRPRHVTQFPLAWVPKMRKFWQTVLSVILDSRYPSRNIESALKKVFRPSRCMSDWSTANEMGLHIGMPVTTTGDASTRIITNYNGTGQRAEQLDYDILRSVCGSTLRVWQALRATTAAPYYFAPQEIDGESYQDGGVGPYNNPAAIAFAEAEALFPESPKPSIIASFGTGSSKANGQRQAKSRKPPRPQRVTKRRKLHRRRQWSDLFAFRVFHAYLSCGDSNRAWNQLLSQRAVPGNGEYFRFDVQYDGAAPSLDNVTDLDEMEELAEECVTGSPTMDRLALCIRAQYFYFELVTEPEFVNGLYECVGHIHCRLEPGSQECTVFLSGLSRSKSQFQVGSQILPGCFHETAATGNDDGYSMKVRFCVAKRQMPFQITLKEGDAESCDISGSPFTVDHLVRAQQLDAWFGTADHRN